MAEQRVMRSPVSMIVGAAVMLVVSTIVFLLIRDDDIERAVAPDLGSTTTTAPALAAEPEAPSRVAPAPVDGPFVEATLTENKLMLSGLVPSATLAGDYLRAAEVAYSPNVRSELIVDEQLPSVDWLVSGPEAIVLLPMITDGTIRISDGQVVVSGRAPTMEGVQQLENALGETTSLPVMVGEVTITELEPPALLLSADEDRVELAGRLPTEELRALLVEGATAAYGEGNVDDQVIVEPGVYPSLWMYNSGPLLGALSVFPAYELRIDGTAFSGFINGGVTFEPGSAEFSGAYAEVLDVGVGVLTRDRSLQLAIEGHTDSDGSDQTNLELSQQRADAVMAYFIANGIAPERLTAVGKGESEPVVPNDTDEGRARNRRIRYVLTSQG